MGGFSASEQWQQGRALPATFGLQGAEVLFQSTGRLLGDLNPAEREISRTSAGDPIRSASGSRAGRWGSRKKRGRPAGAYGESVYHRMLSVKVRYEVQGAPAWERGGWFLPFRNGDPVRGAEY